MFKITVSDSRLWEETKLDNIRAFDMLFERYWPLVYKNAFTILKDSVACSEIVHDIFLNIWQKRHSLQIMSFKNYLTAAARYHVYKQLKLKNAVKLKYIENYDVVPHVMQDANNGDEKIRCLELEDDVQYAINQLPKRCREIFLLSRKEQMNNKDISAQLGISKRSVENQITHALKHLRFYLNHLAVLIVIMLTK